VAAAVVVVVAEVGAGKPWPFGSVSV
jgi:hypothetical protein